MPLAEAENGTSVSGDALASSEHGADTTMLVTQAQRGNRSALEELITRFHGSTRCTAYRYVGNWDRAADVAQDVCIVVSRNISDLHHPASFVSWLQAITRRCAINSAARGPQRHEVTGVEPFQLETHDTVVDAREPIDHLMILERDAQLHRALNQLRDLDRETLEAYYFQEMTLEELACHLHCPVGTAKRRTHVARLRLADLLREAGYEWVNELDNPRSAPRSNGRSRVAPPVRPGHGGGAPGRPPSRPRNVPLPPRNG